MSNKPASASEVGGWVCSTSKCDLSIRKSVTQFIAMIDIKLATPKAGVKQDLLFNKLASEASLLTEFSSQT
jgi:hypothetical protein